MNYWLMKTEPQVFSFEDLCCSPKGTTHWEGVRNYQARNFLRDQFKLKDQVLIYHSNIEEPAILGIAEVVREAYPDETALDRKSPYYDPKAKVDTNPWVCVSVRAILRFERPVTRAQLKEEPGLRKMVVLQKGSRLSIQPVTPGEFKMVLRLGNSAKR